MDYIYNTLLIIFSYYMNKIHILTKTIGRKVPLNKGTVKYSVLTYIICKLYNLEDTLGRWCGILVKKTDFYKHMTK